MARTHACDIVRDGMHKPEIGFDLPERGWQVGCCDDESL